MFIKRTAGFGAQTGNNILVKALLMVTIEAVFTLKAFEGFEPFNTELRPEDICREHRCDNVFVGVDDLPCKCDSSCGYYGDCCWDKATFHNSYSDKYPKRELQRCRRVPGLSLSGIVESHIGHFMVSDCPEDTNDSLQRACTEEPGTGIYVEASSILPVEDEMGFVYKNIYCARCHGVNETMIRIWEVSHWCESCPSWIDLFPSYKVKLDDPNCTLVSSFPLSPYSSARPCISSLKRTCPNDFEDVDVIDKCRNYVSPLRTPVIVYKNPHCVICNGLDALDFIELCTNFKLDNDVYVSDVFRAPWKLNGNFSTSATQIPNDEESGEITILSHCTELFPLSIRFTIVLPNSDTCPFLGKRVEHCVLRELHGIESPSSLGQLHWRQLVPLSDTDPILSPQMLYFAIPDAISSQDNWLSLVSQMHDFIDNKRKVCGFTDIYLLRVCGESTSRDETLMCDNLFESNTSEVLIEIKKYGDTIALHPFTQEALGHVSWFAFLSSFNRSHLETDQTSLCYTNFRPSSSHPNTHISLVETIISSVFISLSTVSLLLTFITYCLFPKLRNTFGLTLMNFVIALAIGQLLIHFVTDYVTQISILCQVVAIATHFFWLATFAWTNLLAWELKSTFRKARLTKDTISKRKMISYACYGWGVPFITVIVCSILHLFFSDKVPISYGLVRGGTCWIGNDDLVAFLVVGGPLAVVILINGVLFLLVVIGIQRSRFRARDGTNSTRHDCRTVIELLVYVKISLLLGFTWTLGYLASFDDTRILWYIYYALQSLQGILIMTFFCFNKRVRPLWKEKLGMAS